MWRSRGWSPFRANPRTSRGVRTSEGDLPADLVIDAAGRRSPIDHWLRKVGARASASWWAECGVAYFSRHYRLRENAAPPAPLTTRIVEALDEFTVGIWGSDNAVMQVVVAPLALDHRFKTLRYPEVFTAVLRSIPTYAAWLDALDPITGVYPMGGMHNTMRRLVVDGAPVATGLLAIGDSVCTTNPTLGRGLALALSGAVNLLEVVDRHRDDWVATAVAMDELVADMWSRITRIRPPRTPRVWRCFDTRFSMPRHQQPASARPIESPLRSCVRQRSSIRRPFARCGD